ncbi:MAG: hypothetical protein ACFCBW_13460 [Candidatus Competibacterales bacterium]
MDITAIKSQPRWQALVAFVDGLFERPLDAESGQPGSALDAVEARIGVSLPLAVREWYQLIGKRPDVTCGDDHITQLHELSPDTDGFLSLYWESQMIWDCGIRMAEADCEDPPAYFKDPEMDYVVDYGLHPEAVVHENLVQLADTVSEFLTHMAMIQRLVGLHDPDLIPAWRPGVWYGQARDMRVKSKAIKELECTKLLELPSGECLHSSAPAALLLEGFSGFFITRDRQLWDQLT